MVRRNIASAKSRNQDPPQQGRKRKAMESSVVVAESNAEEVSVEPKKCRYWMRSATKPAKEPVPPPKKAQKKEKIVLSKVAKPKVDKISSSVQLLDLPNEILGKITGYLSLSDLFRCERVSRKMRTLVKGYTWRQEHVLDHERVIRGTNYPEISLSEHRNSVRHTPIRYQKYHRITNNEVRQIFERAPIRKCDLSIYSHELTYQIGAVFKLAPQLQHLNLSFVRLSNNTLRTIAQYCPQLEECCFESCFCDSRVEQGLEVLFTKCQNIKYLNLAENNKLYGDSFEYIPNGLLYLNLANCYNVSAAAINAMTDAAKNLETLILENYDNPGISNFNNWIRKLSSLKYLEISNVFMGAGYPSLDFSHFPELEMLSLKYNTLVNANSLRTLQNCSKLKSIDLRFGQQFDQSSLDILGKCKNLQFANLSNCSRLANIVAFVKRCKLEYLAINDCRELKAEIIQKLIAECTSLKYIELFGLNIDYGKVFTNVISDQKAAYRSHKLMVSAPRLSISLPPCDWLNIVRCDCIGTTQFARFTSVRNQYVRQQV